MTRLVYTKPHVLLNATADGILPQLTKMRPGVRLSEALQLTSLGHGARPLAAAARELACQCRTRAAGNLSHYGRAAQWWLAHWWAVVASASLTRPLPQPPDLRWRAKSAPSRCDTGPGQLRYHDMLKLATANWTGLPALRQCNRLY